MGRPTGSPVIIPLSMKIARLLVPTKIPDLLPYHPMICPLAVLLRVSQATLKGDYWKNAFSKLSTVQLTVCSM